MTKRDLEEKGFEQAVEELQEQNASITTYDALKDFAIQNIENENLFVAIHILQSINEEQAEYYDYDYSMGTLDTPRAITTLEDLEDYLED